jgi:hypothetical protein
MQHAQWKAQALLGDLNSNLKKKTFAHMKQQCACTHNPSQYSSSKPPNHIIANIPNFKQ